MQVTSKLSPITSYEGAVEGLVTHGCITGIEEFGCFVSFYNEVKGLAHKYGFRVWSIDCFLHML